MGVLMILARLTPPLVWRRVVPEGAESKTSGPENTDDVSRSLSLPLVLIAFGLVTLLLSAGVLVTYFAYDRQASKVEDLELSNQKIQMEHVAIGGLIQKQQKTYAKSIRTAQAKAARQFTQGFRAGKRADNLPRALRLLEPYIARGLRVPRTVPVDLSQAARVGTRSDGYTLRWSQVSVFASTSDPLSIWTRQGWPGYKQKVRVGRRSVFRILGPYGVMFAWRERGDTYAVLSYPQARWESAARRLITSMA
jgi:hypothetical protein